jgi:hypothetical protein
MILNEKNKPVNQKIIVKQYSEPPGPAKTVYYNHTSLYSETHLK